MIKIIRKWISYVGHYIWSLFLNGLITILPIIITIAIFTISFRLLKGWFEPLQTIVPPFFAQIPHAEIILGIIIIFIIGTILKIFVIRTLIHKIEKIIINLPLVRPVYTGIKQLILAFSSQDTVTFQRVVFLEFPRQGIFSIGFLTSEVPRELAPNKDEQFFSIFVPTTPNPTSGYFVMVPARSFTIIDITRQEAMALIISGGIIQPENLRMKQ